MQKASILFKGLIACIASVIVSFLAVGTIILFYAALFYRKALGLDVKAKVASHDLEEEEDRISTISEQVHSVQYESAKKEKSAQATSL